MTISFLERLDFERARTEVSGFERWNTFEDYQSDRDGLLIGLAWAGELSRMVPVSVESFLLWCATRRIEPDLERLDEFAGVVEALRLRPQPSFRACLIHGDEPEIQGEPLMIPVDERSYHDWLSCLAEDPHPRLLHAYAALFVEAWTEIPQPSDFDHDNHDNRAL